MAPLALSGAHAHALASALASPQRWLVGAGGTRTDPAAVAAL